MYVKNKSCFEERLKCFSLNIDLTQSIFFSLILSPIPQQSIGKFNIFPIKTVLPTEKDLTENIQ